MSSSIAALMVIAALLNAWSVWRAGIAARSLRRTTVYLLGALRRPLKRGLLGPRQRRG
ncbi:MAG TPA: hypothetical protein VFS09_06515 [Candidatus Eisenbacteria bacterium]|nr:hypothetical protein [Candidatus Eisenbacteria bacterium]